MMHQFTMQHANAVYMPQDWVMEVYSRIHNPLFPTF